MAFALVFSTRWVWSGPVAALLIAAAPPDIDKTAATDARLAAIAYRLQTGNAALCRRLAPVPGVALLSIGQYPPRDRALAANMFSSATSVFVEAVVPGSPADRAGLRRGDALVAIGGVAVDQSLTPAASAAGRDAVLDLLARQPVERSVSVVVRGQDRERSIVLLPSPGCRAIVEVKFGAGLSAQADDRRIQIGGGFFDRYDDASVAVVVAHELAHIILDHHDRLKAAGVGHGVLAGYGRDGRIVRRTEDAADALSVALLYNAGFDPHAAVAFWRDHGRDFGSGFLHRPTHGGVDDRMRVLETEIARIPMEVPKPYVPAVLASRDDAL